MELYLAALRTVQKHLNDVDNQIDDLITKRNHLWDMRREAVRAARHEAGIPARRIANELGYARSFVYKMLKGTGS